MASALHVHQNSMVECVMKSALSDVKPVTKKQGCVKSVMKGIMVVTVNTSANIVFFIDVLWRESVLVIVFLDFMARIVKNHADSVEVLGVQKNQGSAKNALLDIMGGTAIKFV